VKLTCRFHVTQSWWRAIQRFGLTEDYKRKTEVGDWLRICYGLLTQFADYILDAYTTEETLLPSNIWAQCSVELNLTTNSHLAQTFANTHRNIHRITKALLDIQLT